MFKKEIYSLLLFSFGLLFTCCGESATESEKKDKDASGKKSGKSFFKTAADAEKYLNEKNEDTVPDNGLEEKEFDESGEVSNDVSDNGLSGDKQDSFAASEEEKGEE